MLPSQKIAVLLGLGAFALLSGCAENPPGPLAARGYGPVGRVPTTGAPYPVERYDTNAWGNLVPHDYLSSGGQGTMEDSIYK